MQLVCGHDADVAAWVAARIPQMTAASDFGPCTAIGVVGADGQPLGGVVFHNWQPRFRNIEISFAADSARWLTRRLIVGILSYPFDQLGVARLTTLTPKKNRPARKFIDRFGFRREGVLRRGFGDDDMIVSGLMRREWVAGRYGPVSTALSAPAAQLCSAAEPR